MATATVPPRMMNEAQAQQNAGRNIQCAVLDDGEIALVRVGGRANFMNSLPLKKFAATISEAIAKPRFIVDLHECESMDSTFMGVLAGICITLSQKGAPRMIVLNANEHCCRLLKNLGLTHLLELRKEGDIPALNVTDADFQEAGPTQITRTEQICLTLQAHKDLVRIDGGNEVRFQAVIEYLEESLNKEGAPCPPDKKPE